MRVTVSLQFKMKTQHNYNTHLVRLWKLIIYSQWTYNVDHKPKLGFAMISQWVYIRCSVCL